MKQKLLELKGGIAKTIIILGVYNIPSQQDIELLEGRSAGI